MEAPVETAVKSASARRGLLARFARDRRGVAALEFGMVSIPFLGLLCAIFETAFVYYNHEVFDNAVANVARQILVNQYGSAQTPKASDFVSSPAPTGSNGYSLCAALPTYFTCANIRVNVAAYATGGFSGLGAAGAIDRGFQNAGNFAQQDPTQTNINLGQPGNIVVFQAFYPMPIYLSVLLASGSQGNQTANLYGQSSVSAGANPTGGSGLVHYLYSVLVFRNEPQ